ncbi:MAG: bifunctional alpha,alpha-trehalose-phosphate synthase (UDP-forming)/trehalose-phosphatase [Spirochaetia bacterium]|nr:bifunctional alpha,alpha-trehalose-phosphate synthase (UDP-forming)/trehalose-phosphatase [Spirochaetia bacterium]
MNRNIILVSNRLPVSFDFKKEKLKPSSGGLVSALSGIKEETIWAGTFPFEQKNVSLDKNLIPVFIEDELYNKYYNNFCNEVLWPLFHYETTHIKCSREDWEAYKKVNRIFAEKILEKADSSDLIWIHDFHLFLLPKYIRELNKDIKTGFFLHIPFPSAEIFRELPYREEILDGVLNADLIGFHDYTYLRHFIETLHYLLSIESDILSVEYENRKVQLGVFPVSIDTQKFISKSQTSEVKNLVKQIKKEAAGKKLILGVDRLDYIKGVDLKLDIFQKTLEMYPELRGKISLLQIAIPTRSDVDEYISLKNNIDRKIGEINGNYGTTNYVPVKYIYNSVDFNTLVSLYGASDVLLISSKRDGMNLVALEYIVSQTKDNPGVVLLSEFTGAASNLSHIISINPWNTENSASKLYDALDLKPEEKWDMLKPMISYLEKYTATKWAQTFLTELENCPVSSPKKISTIQKEQNQYKFPENLVESLKNKKIIIFLDYDGTIVAIKDNPEDAVLESVEKKLLKRAASLKNTTLIIISGRSQNFLSNQLKEFNISYALEHGAYFFDHLTKEYISLVTSKQKSWYPIVKKIMQDYSLHVPGSFVEEKKHSICWHYRKSPRLFAKFQARKLHDELERGLSNMPVSIIQGKKIIEAKALEANKGIFTKWLIEREFNNDSVLLAFGDDKTDEEMFETAKEYGYCFKVGKGDSIAHFRLQSYKDVLPFIIELTEKIKR